MRIVWDFKSRAWGAQGLVGFPAQTFHLKLAESGEGTVDDLCDSNRG